LIFDFEQLDTQSEISVNQNHIRVPLLSLQRIRFKEVAAQVSENEM